MSDTPTTPSPPRIFLTLPALPNAMLSAQAGKYKDGSERWMRLPVVGYLVTIGWDWHPGDDPEDPDYEGRWDEEVEDVAPLAVWGSKRISPMERFTDLDLGNGGDSHDCH